MCIKKPNEQNTDITRPKEIVKNLSLKMQLTIKTRIKIFRDKNKTEK